jgi:hypothetical protein
MRGPGKHRTRNSSCGALHLTAIDHAREALACAIDSDAANGRCSAIREFVISVGLYGRYEWTLAAATGHPELAYGLVLNKRISVIQSALDVR